MYTIDAPIIKINQAKKEINIKAGDEDVFINAELRSDQIHIQTSGKIILGSKAVITCHDKLVINAHSLNLNSGLVIADQIQTTFTAAPITKGLLKELTRVPKQKIPYFTTDTKPLLGFQVQQLREILSECKQSKRYQVRVHPNLQSTHFIDLNQPSPLCFTSNSDAPHRYRVPTPIRAGGRMPKLIDRYAVGSLPPRKRFRQL